MILSIILRNRSCNIKLPTFSQYIKHSFNWLLYDRQDIDLWNGKPSRIFENMDITPPNIPELKTWAILEQRELKALMTYPPANIFQELILWTEQGKLWKFPINNEQGFIYSRYFFSDI